MQMSKLSTIFIFFTYLTLMTNSLVLNNRSFIHRRMLQALQTNHRLLNGVRKQEDKLTGGIDSIRILNGVRKQDDNTTGGIDSIRILNGVRKQEDKLTGGIDSIRILYPVKVQDNKSTVGIDLIRRNRILSKFFCEKIISKKIIL